ncbi:MAG: proline iminopeptidase-family hydrolase [Bacteroidota bacterium]
MDRLATYFDRTGRPDVLTGGVRLLPVTTPHGTFRVWTKRVGNNPRIKVLLLHGGPGMTHELYEVFDSFFPEAAIEYYYYDQLGSHYSDQPDDDRLWDTARFVEEVEQVRQALGLTPDNFFLFGQSWGGLLALEYALAHQQHLKGLIVSNMMASIPAYNRYAADVLGPHLPPDVLAEVRALEDASDYENPRYEELLMTHYYPKHVLRRSPEEWPEPVLRSLNHLNPAVYVPMQGPSEFGVIGKLEPWDRTADLAQIAVPTLTIGAAHDTMDPEHMAWMATQVQRGRHLHCPDGSHLAQYDDMERYFEGLIAFLQDVDAGAFDGG